MEYFSITLREYKDDNFVGHVQIGTDIKYIDDKRVYIHDLYVIKAYRHKGESIKLRNKVINYFSLVITNVLELETAFKPSLKPLMQRTKWQKHQD